MANKKISELVVAGALTGTELVEGVQGGVNVQMTTQDIADLGGGGGSFTASDQPQSEAIASQATVGSTVGLTDARGLGEVSAYYFIRKVFSIAQTFAIGPIITDATVNTLAWFNASKKLVTAVVTDALDYLLINPVPVTVALSGSTITLDCASRYSRKWYTSTAHSANFTLTKTNKTLIEYGNYVFFATGTITIQLDSDDRMPDDTMGWTYASKQLQIITGGTGLMYSLAFNKIGSNYFVTLSTKATV